MTKGFCKCGKIIDEVIFSQFGMCKTCFDIKELFARDKQIREILRFWIARYPLNDVKIMRMLNEE